MGGGGIGKGGAGDFGGADHGPFVDAVIIKHPIALFHLTEEVAGLVVADPVPDHFLFLEETGEGVGGGFLFHKPMAHEAKDRQPLFTFTITFRGQMGD